MDKVTDVKDLNPYTVLQNLTLPHCEEGEHEAFAPCPDCNPDLIPDARDGMVVVDKDKGIYQLCPTCKGTRGGGPSLGMAACTNVGGTYGPGQTVHLSADAAKPLVKGGQLAPAGSDKVEQLLVRAAADRVGLKIAED